MQEQFLDLKIDESSVQAFDSEAVTSHYSTYSSCSCINPPCPIAG